MLTHNSGFRPRRLGCPQTAFLVSALVAGTLISAEPSAAQLHSASVLKAEVKVPRLEADRTEQPQNAGTVEIPSAWDQMFGGFPVDGPYEVLPYWNADSVQLFLIDTTTPPPEAPVTLLDLYERWAVASGFLYVAEEHWDITVSRGDGSFMLSIVWGWYEAIPSSAYNPDPGLNLIVGAFSSWQLQPAGAGTENSRGVIDQFLPLQGVAEIELYRAELFNPDQYALEQVAAMLARILAPVAAPAPEGGSGNNDCPSAKQNPNGLPQASLDIWCLNDVVQSTSFDQCLDDNKACISQATAAHDAAVASCDSSRAINDVLILGCAALPTPPTAIVCALGAASFVTSAWKSCLRAAKITYVAARKACAKAYLDCCRGNNSCIPF